MRPLTAEESPHPRFVRGVAVSAPPRRGSAYSDAMSEQSGGGRLTAAQRVRQVGNWLNLSTPSGRLVARLGGARVRRGPRGLLLADGYRWGFPIASAFTVGNVVISRGRWSDLLAAGPALLQHEERHSWQYLLCGGLPMIPLYLLAMAWSWWRTGSPALGNIFERAAGLADGGYR